jgi:hypothetical protein
MGNSFTGAQGNAVEKSLPYQHSNDVQKWTKSVKVSNSILFWEDSWKSLWICLLDIGYNRVSWCHLTAVPALSERVEKHYKQAYLLIIIIF